MQFERFCHAKPHESRNDFARANFTEPRDIQAFVRWIHNPGVTVHSTSPASRVQKRKITKTSVPPAMEAFTARKNKKMRLLAAWSAILKDHWNSHLHIVAAADAGNATG